MSRFSTGVWGAESSTKHAQLQVAFTLWLRTLNTDCDLGLASIMKLLVVQSNELYFPAPKEAKMLERQYTNTGARINGRACEADILWYSDVKLSWLTLDYFQSVSWDVRIHQSWLEIGFALACDSLYNHGINWYDEAIKFQFKPKTIGGLETADWL